MIRDAAIQGAHDAAVRFRVREASVLQTLLGMLGTAVGGSVAKGAFTAASPRLMTSLENLGAAPVNAVRRAVTPGPADLFAKHLNAAQPIMPKAPIT